MLYIKMAKIHWAMGTHPGPTQLVWILPNPLSVDFTQPHREFGYWGRFCHMPESGGELQLLKVL